MGSLQSLKGVGGWETLRNPKRSGWVGNPDTLKGVEKTTLGVKKTTLGVEKTTLGVEKTTLGVKKITRGRKNNIGGRKNNIPIGGHIGAHEFTY